MQTANEKVLDRIRKLLSMAADTSSPNEAAIAAGRARKLMDQHQLTELDLKTSKDADFGISKTVTLDKSVSGKLALAMARLNDCIAEYDMSGPIPLITFKGFLVDTVTAKELLLYLLAQCEVQAQKVSGRKAPFKHGFAAGVQAQVRELLKDREQLKTSSGTALVVVKRSLVEQRYGVQKTSASRANRTDPNYSAGYAAGQRINLSRQVSGQTQHKLT